MCGVWATWDGSLWAEECGDEKLVGQAGVVKERVAGGVMGEMSVAGDGKYSVRRTARLPRRRRCEVLCLCWGQI